MAWIGITGFGSFVNVPHNPSGAVAEALAEDVDREPEVRSVVLPVSFDGSPPALDAWLLGQEGTPAALLALGVHKGPTFRLERFARTVLHSAKIDNDGVLGGGRRLEGDDLETTADLERLAQALERGGAPQVAISEDAGGFVCERTYHHVLSRAHALGVVGVFLHVPAPIHLAAGSQVPVVRALVDELARQSGIT